MGLIAYLYKWASGNGNWLLEYNGDCLNWVLMNLHKCHETTSFQSTWPFHTMNPYQTKRIDFRTASNSFSCLAISFMNEYRCRLFTWIIFFIYVKVSLTPLMDYMAMNQSIICIGAINSDYSLLYKQ